MNSSDEPDSAHDGTRPGDAVSSRDQLHDPHVVALIDAACDRFETEWRAGTKPRLEEFLLRAEAPLQADLFAALLPVEIELRRKAGELPEATGYRQRFPQFDTAITLAFQQQDGLSKTHDRPSSQIVSPSTPLSPPNVPLGGSSPQLSNTTSQPKSSSPPPSSKPASQPPSKGSSPSVESVTWPVGRACENVAEFQQALTAAAIVPPEKLTAFVSANQAAMQTDDIARWAKRLIKAGLLTEYQVQRVYAGRGASLTLGNYILLDKLGQGGMGTVMKARHKKMGRLVALKMLSADLMKSPDAVKRFRQEVQAAAKLNHSNIVIAFDADEANGIHFLVMELVEGPDLAAVIKERGPQSPAVVIDYVRQAATGLAYAHSLGIIHRDIKPSNLLLTNAGQIKVLDMGLARMEAGFGGLLDHQEAASAVTKTGQIMGTIDFMAPEQAVDTRKADARADIYSLGCTLYRLLTGQNVFEGDTLMSKLLAHREAPIPSLMALKVEAEGLRDGQSAASSPRHDPLAALDQAFQHMVAKKPEDRFQTMREVIEALDRCLAPHEIAAQRTGPTQRTDALTGNTHPITATATGDEDLTVLSHSFDDAAPTSAPPGVSSRMVLAGATLIGLVMMVAVFVWPLVFKPTNSSSGHSAATGSSSSSTSDESAPGSGSTEASNTKTETPLSAAWSEREALAWTLDNRGFAKVQPVRGDLIEVREAAQIPTAEFHIESLSVTGLRGEIDANLTRLRGLGSLKELDLSETELTDSGAALLERFPVLTSLHVRGCPLSDAGLKSIGKLTRLTFLSVGERSSSNGPRGLEAAGQSRLSDAGLRELHSLAKLESLTLASRNITEAGLARLIEFYPDLVTLHIELAPLTDSTIEPLSTLKHLRTLSLIQSKLTDGAMNSLTQLTRLHTLNVQGSQITGDGVRRLTSALPGCRIFGGEYSPQRNQVRAIVQAQGRVKVSIPGGATREITDTTFHDLPTEFVTQRIDLHNVRPLPPDLLQLKDATELILTDSGISSTSIRRLPQLFPNLIELNLAGTEITDAEITALASLTSLQRIDLTRTQVSATGHAALKQANPTCEIKWTAP